MGYLALGLDIGNTVLKIFILNDNDLTERELGLHFGNVLMSHCSEVWVFGEIISAGMDAEIRRAKRKNYRLRYFGSDLKEVSKDA